jgi:hypothetical protein
MSTELADIASYIRAILRGDLLYSRPAQPISIFLSRSNHWTRRLRTALDSAEAIARTKWSGIEMSAI